MTQRTIEVIVSPAGETNVQTKGFAGASCRDASRFLEEALGTRASEQLTGEFYDEQPQQRQVQEGGQA
jgi:hypothetical protein